MDDVDRSEFTAYLGSAQVLSGHVDEGIQTYLKLLTGDAAQFWRGTHLIRNKLVDVLRQVVESSPPDHRIVQLVSELLQGWEGQPHKADMALNAKTNGELYDILMATHPSAS
jgi:hypothetical protein